MDIFIQLLHLLTTRPKTLQVLNNNPEFSLLDDTPLLPDTKLTENIIQHILVSDHARYFSNEMQTMADVQREQIARQSLIHTVSNIAQ